MPRLALAVQSYRLDSVPAQQQRLVNLYAERLPPDSKSPVIVRNVPGCVPWAAATTGGVGKVQNLLEWNGYVISFSSNGAGNFDIYRFDAAATNAFIGNVPGPITPLTVATSATQMAICANGNGYVVTYPG